MVKKLTIIFLILFCASCVQDIDLDQIDDIEINTTHIASLIHFTLDTSNFLDDVGNEILFISDTTRSPIFSGDYTENYLIQADFNYKFTNTFNRQVDIQYEFLDEFDNSLFMFQQINIATNSFDYQVTQTIVESDIPAVIPTDKVVVSFLMSAGNPPLDLSQGYSFNLQSAVTLHYKVTVDEEN